MCVCRESLAMKKKEEEFLLLFLLLIGLKMEVSCLSFKDRTLEGKSFAKNINTFNAILVDDCNTSTSTTRSITSNRQRDT